MTALLQQLHDYRPADALETRHWRSIVDLVTNCAAPFSRRTFDPGHITASCFIVDHDARLLLHHHKRLGRWLQMGGHLDEGETPVAAALREGREESGLADLELLSDAILDLEVHPIPAGKGEPEHHHFDVRFVARTAAPASIALDASESNDLAWFSFRRAVTLMNEDASARAIRKIERLVNERRAS